MKRAALCCCLFIGASAMWGQSTSAPQSTLKQREQSQTNGGYQVTAGTHILLTMINSVSTKVAQPGDRIYLETAFPIFVERRLVIPQGSWVTGTVTEVKRPGRVKGRGELRVRFDSLMLPNGVTRAFHPDLSEVDERQNEALNRETGKVTGGGSKKEDAGTVVGTTAAGTVIGSGIGAAAGNVARGAGIGVGAGAAAGLLGVLLTRGPDAMLRRGSTVEMVLNQPLTFHQNDIDFSRAPQAATPPEGTPPPEHRSGFTRFP
jgi:type IV secretion system protein VirB10